MTSDLIFDPTFGTGLVMRPLGGLLLGIYADRTGRKAALTRTIWLMALGAAILCLAPTYATAGIWGPIILVVGRLIQGLSAGGELGGATAMLVECAPPNR